MQRGVIILFIRFHRLGSDKLKHVCQKKKKKQAVIVFFPSRFPWYVECQHQWKVLLLSHWMPVWQSDSPQSPCHKESRHHPHNYSNWAAAGDSPSCLFFSGLNNQTLV